MRLFDDNAYENHIGYGKWKLTKGNFVMTRGERSLKLYCAKALTEHNMNIMYKLDHSTINYIF